jgi:hypothetical protein
MKQNDTEKKKGWILHICPECGKKWTPEIDTDEMRAMFSYCRDCRELRTTTILPDSTICRI